MGKAFRGTYSVLSDSLLDDNCHALQVFFIVITYKKEKLSKTLFSWFHFLKDTESYHLLAPNTIFSS